MSDDEGLAPSWLSFGAKIVIAIAWLAVAGWAAATLLHGGDRWAQIGAALAMLALPVAWFILKFVTLSRGDEVKRAATLRGLAQGLLMAAVLPGAMIGGSVLSSLFLGAGEVNVSGMMQNGVTFIATLPPIAFFLSELFAFALLMTYAKRGS